MAKDKRGKDIKEYPKLVGPKGKKILVNTEVEEAALSKDEKKDKKVPGWGQ